MSHSSTTTLDIDTAEPEVLIEEVIRVLVTGLSNEGEELIVLDHLQARLVAYMNELRRGGAVG